MRKLLPLISVLALSSACSFYARSPEDYRTETRKVLEQRSDQIKGCYDGVLKQNPNAAGTVIVHFTVKEETGMITAAEVLPDSTAPTELGQCIVQALDGLQLDPPDEREGDATFMWEFANG